MVFFSPFHSPVIGERYHAFFISSYPVFLLSTLRCNIKWWLDNKMTYSPELMDEMYRKLALPGIAQT
jgi:hypothetical protein